jgi:hypothetical protein
MVLLIIGILFALLMIIAYRKAMRLPAEKRHKLWNSASFRVLYKVVAGFYCLIIGIGLITYLATDKKEVVTIPVQVAAPEVNPYIASNPPMSEAKTPHQRFLYKYVTLYDGECFRLKYAIKQGMNDPSSYEHVKTDCHMNEKTCIETVKTIISGKNAFGALVVAKYVAQMDTNGNILSLKQQ